MSGHSKWSKIKRQKQAQDVAKGALFSKLSRLITLSVLQGGGVIDPALNVTLRIAIDKAKQQNMPKDTIQRAIEKGSGLDKANLREVQYEAFAPFGTVMLILGATDNPNRTLHEVKSILERQGAKLGGHGTVAYQFQRCGVVYLKKDSINEENLLTISEKLNAFEIEEDDDTYFIYFPFEKIGKVEGAEIDYKPTTMVTLKNKEQDTIKNLIEALESLDDVQDVFTNAYLL